MYDMSPDADGGGDEEEQESPVVGVPGGPRLGKERRVPQGCLCDLSLYFFNLINLYLWY